MTRLSPDFSAVAGPALARLNAVPAVKRLHRFLATLGCVGVGDLENIWLRGADCNRCRSRYRATLAHDELILSIRRKIVRNDRQDFSAAGINQRQRGSRKQHLRACQRRGERQFGGGNRGCGKILAGYRNHIAGSHYHLACRPCSAGYAARGYGRDVRIRRQHAGEFSRPVQRRRSDVRVGGNHDLARFQVVSKPNALPSPSL